MDQRGLTPPVLTVAGGRKRRNWSYKIRGVWHQRELQRLVVCFDCQRGVIQRKLVPWRGIHQPINWRRGIGPRCCRGPRNRRLSKMSIIISPLHHFTCVFSAPHHFTIFTFHHVYMVVFYELFFHIRFTIALYQSILPYLHFTFLTLFNNFAANKCKKGHQIREPLNYLDPVVWMKMIMSQM